LKLERSIEEVSHHRDEKPMPSATMKRNDQNSGIDLRYCIECRLGDLLGRSPCVGHQRISVEKQRKTEVRR
jgi:hypothetical protein